MRFLYLALPIFAALGASAKQNPTESCHTFPSSVIEFSGNFQQPQPPLLKTELQTSFIQHKWYIPLLSTP
jgi:hypothetical protein